jgi:hypothetical protein
VAEIQGSRELGGSRGRSPKVGCFKSRVARLREDLSRPSEEDRWQRSRDLDLNSGARRVEVQKYLESRDKSRSSEVARGCEPSIWGGQVAEIEEIS